jgi:hypothetical protein
MPDSNITPCASSKKPQKNRKMFEIPSRAQIASFLMSEIMERYRNIKINRDVSSNDPGTPEVLESYPC